MLQSDKTAFVGTKKNTGVASRIGRLFTRKQKQLTGENALLPRAAYEESKKRTYRQRLGDAANYTRKAVSKVGRAALGATTAAVTGALAAPVFAASDALNKGYNYATGTKVELGKDESLSNMVLKPAFNLFHSKEES